MRLHNISYLFKEGTRNVFSNKLMSFACIGVLVACFLLIGAAVLFSMTVSNIVQYVEDQNEVVVFLEDGMTLSQVEAVGADVQSMGNVSYIRFIPKAEALENEKAKAEEYAFLFDGLEESNPYPDTYIVRVEDLGILDDTVARIREMDGVEKVNAQTEVAAILQGLSGAVAMAGTGVVVILVAVSMVIITNTIKLTVFSRRREINIMKYVGATDSFIRMPFVVEGMLIGLFAAIFAFFILGFAYTYLLDWAGENYAEYIGIVFNNAVAYQDVALYMLGGFAVIGICIGMVGSGMFVRKYLKV